MRGQLADPNYLSYCRAGRRCVPLHLSITAMLADPNYRSYCRAGSRCVLLNLSLTAMLADPNYRSTVARVAAVCY